MEEKIFEENLNPSIIIISILHLVGYFGFEPAYVSDKVTIFLCIFSYGLFAFSV